MDTPETIRVYPAAPLETVIVHEQQPLMKNAPPTYDQATNTAVRTPAPTAGQNAPTVVIIPQSAIGQPYGPHPIDMLCPFCHNYTRTKIRHQPSSRTHLIALLLCVLQLYCCVCLPYIIGSCMRANHYCGLCGNYLGTYDRT